MNIFSIICYFNEHRWSRLLLNEYNWDKRKYQYWMMCDTCFKTKWFSEDQYICGVCKKETCDGLNLVCQSKFLSEDMENRLY